MEDVKERYEVGVKYVGGISSSIMYHWVYKFGEEASISQAPQG